MFLNVILVINQGFGNLQGFALNLFLNVILVINLQGFGNALRFCASFPKSLGYQKLDNQVVCERLGLKSGLNSHEINKFNNLYQFTNNNGSHYATRGSQFQHCH